MLKVSVTKLLIINLTKMWQMMNAVPLIITPWGLSLKPKSGSFQCTPLNFKLIFSNFFIIQEQDLEGRGIKCWKFWQLSYWFSLWQKYDNWCMPYPWSSIREASAWNQSQVPFSDSTEFQTHSFKLFYYSRARFQRTWH